MSIHKKSAKVCTFFVINAICLLSLNPINQLGSFDDIFLPFLNEKICKYQKFFVSLYQISKEEEIRTIL